MASTSHKNVAIASVGYSGGLQILAALNNSAGHLSEKDFAELVEIVRSRFSTCGADSSSDAQVFNIDLLPQTVNPAELAGLIDGGERLLLRQTIVRSSVMDGSAEALHNEPQYELSVTQHAGEGALSVAIAPPCTSPEQIDGLPQLSLHIEINQGLPCVHLYGNTAYGEVVQSIFADCDGLLHTRPGDASESLQPVPKMYLPDAVEVADRFDRIRTALEGFADLPRPG